MKDIFEMEHEPHWFGYFEDGWMEQDVNASHVREDDYRIGSQHIRDTITNEMGINYENN